MGKAVNDATLQKVGDVYQYLIALRDCFDLNDDDTLQIETNGDVSIINDGKGRFQREVKHHFGNKYISDRDIDFWKTLANWYEDYERIKNFSNYILSTTAAIKSNSLFHNWNDKKNTDKLKLLKGIGNISKKNEKTFRYQYNRIFNEFYNESCLLEILDKFTIEAAKTSIDGISNEFSRYVGHIPSENRDRYIGSLLGEILIKVKAPPHKWKVTKLEFDKILQVQSTAYGTKGIVPLPNEYAKAVIPRDKISTLQDKKFVESIREIKHDQMIQDAVSDYWKADLTVAKYFRDNLMYLQSLEFYREDLSAKMKYSKANSDLNAEGATEEEQTKISKRLYNDIMGWNVIDFGSIIRNQGYFQRGVIHNIVDETDFKWKVGEGKNEHK
ncbi:ABC-three component system protein [Oribacterium sinus]